ncbi:H/ACA ribonucleoprotein complex non-core subunit NAF1 isoform X2 [Ahaetulla prasina]|uniref:H/ACA ribonucleoprotein complex non-core subunit NAF1 isoform X2 n=1 Tax=Ahaetulla prasina TaxID=499056 RepID=UPI002648E2F1|nr:H/ACA ribonucleoprotein complex non-core subunit NAF1 isoform X2 [Ahaetulla prasina]
MDASPVPPLVDADSGLAGSIVAERLQTLRVACDGSADARAAGPLSPERLCEGAPANSSELPREAEPPWVALKGGGDAGGAPPHSSAAAEEKPAAVGDCNGQASPGTGDEQPKALEASSDKEEEAKVVDHHQPSSSSSSPAFQGGSSEGNGDLDRPTAALGLLEGEALPKEKPAAQRSEKEGPLSGEGGGRSESDSDTDADSSSSLSSSSCPPLLSDDDQQDKNENNSTKKKSELTKKEPSLVEDLMIILPESVKLMPFGQVSSIVEHQVIIESEKGLPPVNENTVLFKENRHSLGKIFEIFGPVSHPFYVVQFNSPEHIQSKDIKIKDAVYFAPAVESFTQYIFPEKLKQEKGSDASWKNDDEPPPEALDFSDDEKEKIAKSHKKSQNIKRKKLRSQQNDSNDNGPNYRSRRQPPSEYSGGYCRGQPTTRFSWGRPPHVASFPHFYRQHNITPQYYSSDYAHLQKPPTFCEQQRLESMRRHQYSFPPPSFETVSHNTNFPPPPPPPPIDWGWPPTCPQNTYEPLLSMLSLPPPPPPPLPPPSIEPNTGSSP